MLGRRMPASPDRVTLAALDVTQGTPQVPCRTGSASKPSPTRLTLPEIPLSEHHCGQPPNMTKDSTTTDKNTPQSETHNDRFSNKVIAGGIAVTLLVGLGTPAAAAAMTGENPVAPAAASANSGAKGQKSQPQQPIHSAKASKKYAKTLMKQKYGWGESQYQDLVALWNRESGWNYQATNASSGAYGIPQSLPGSKMSSAGKDWKTNAATQIKWGLRYIKDTYGSPAGALAHENSAGWY